MKKFLFALATMALLFSAAPVFAECSLSKTEFTIQVKAIQQNNPLKVLDLTGIPMENFMSFMNSQFGPPPVEYDNVVIQFNDENAKVVLFKDGCLATQTGTFPRFLINNYLREAKLVDDNG